MKCDLCKKLYKVCTRDSYFSFHEGYKFYAPVPKSERYYCKDHMHLMISTSEIERPYDEYMATWNTKLRGKDVEKESKAENCEQEA